MSKYAALIRLAFLKGLAYRWEVVWGIVSSLLLVIFYRCLWSSIYGGAENIAGMTLNQIINYYLWGQLIVIVTASKTDRILSREIMNGTIVNRFIRPLRLYTGCLFDEVGSSLKNTILTGLPIGMIAVLLVPVYFPGEASIVVGFLASLLLAFLLKYNINFLAGLLACWIKGSEGITHAKDFLMMLCTGALLPLSFYPAWMQSVFAVLPFRFIVYVPIQIWNSAYSLVDMSLLLLQAVLWTVALGFLNQVAVRQGIRKITGYGG